VSDVKIVDEKPFNYEFECRGCKSKLAAEAKDVKVGLFGSMGDYDREYYVECPVCGTIRTLEYTQLTPKVQAMADRKEKRR
jgi:hypothetical protein